MMLVRTNIAASSIEGLGVFAAEPIPKGTVVWRFDMRFDRLIAKTSLGDAPKALQEYLERYGYDYYADARFICVDVDDGVFMNHSDDPNCDWSQPDQGIAKRDIGAGEELTCDYRTVVKTALKFDARAREGWIKRLVRWFNVNS